MTDTGDWAEAGNEAGRFETTDWSLVLAAGEEPTAKSREALESLCQTYWQPVYFFIRRQGRGVEDAQDLTQGFLAQMLERSMIQQADSEKGRFRSFLLASVQNFIRDEQRKDRALKRGGGALILSLDFEMSESAFRLEPADTLTPDRIFDRKWALGLLERVADQLQAEYEKRGKQDLFECLRSAVLEDSSDETYALIGGKLAMTEGAVKIAARRLRQQFGERLKREIDRTVDSPALVEEEISYLIQAVSQHDSG